MEEEPLFKSEKTFFPPGAETDKIILLMKEEILSLREAVEDLYRRVDELKLKMSEGRLPAPSEFAPPQRPQAVSKGPRKEQAVSPSKRPQQTETDKKQPSKDLRFVTVDNQPSKWMKSVSDYFAPTFKSLGIKDATIYVHRVTDQSRFIQRNFTVRYYPAFEIVVQTGTKRGKNTNIPHDDPGAIMLEPFYFTVLEGEAVFEKPNGSDEEQEKTRLNRNERTQLTKALLSAAPVKVKSCISCGAAASLMDPATQETFCAKTSCHK